MMKVSIDSSFTRQMRNKPRKSLQSLQLSADVPNSMADSKMVLVSIDKESKITETVKTPGKENKITLRRSKRRIALADVGTNTVVVKANQTSHIPMVANEKLVTKSIQKLKKGNSAAVKKIEQNSNQSKLNLLIPSTSTYAEDLNSDVKSNVNKKQISDEIVRMKVNESSVTADGTLTPSFLEGTLDLPEVRACLSMTGNNITVFSDPGASSNCLTDVEPSLQYWKTLTEERRIALEKVLHENELLQDQLSVLEAENNQLKSLVKDAEQMVSVLKGILE